MDQTPYPGPQPYPEQPTGQGWQPSPTPIYGGMPVPVPPPASAPPLSAPPSSGPPLSGPPSSAPPGWGYPAQGWGYAPAPVPPPRRRTGLIVGLGGGAVALLLLCVLGVGAYKLNLGPLKDSGLAECQTIHDAAAADRTDPTAAPSTSTSDEGITLDQYHDIRKKFADSRYGDIRDAGTRFVDLLWQLSEAARGSDEDALGAALMLASQLYAAYSSLAGACSNHGVDIPPLAGN